MRPHAPRTRIERQAADAVRRVRRALAADIRSGRADAGISLRRLAATAGVSAATIRAIEQEEHEPSLQVIARLATALGMSLGLPLYPGTGPLIRDHIQALMLTGLLGIIHPRWRRRPEVAVWRPVRGVIDLVLDTVGEPIVACEAHSELRRLEQQIRWSRSKADALASARDADDGRTPHPVGRLLLLRSTVRTRSIVAQHADLVAAAYPTRATDAHAALTSEAPWSGDAILWCRVESGTAVVLERPPRGITVGR
jgi:transcriptional regulator with XRE-family HTH domain